MGLPAVSVQAEPACARLARRLLIAAGAVWPLETGVRWALDGARAEQQLRVAEHWLRQITNGFVPGQPMPFVWLALLVASGGFAAVAALRGVRAGSLAVHALVVGTLGVWFAKQKLLELLALLAVLVVARAIRAGGRAAVPRRVAVCFGSACVLLAVAGATTTFAEARSRANLRACIANQRTLTGAVEMYNLDKNVQVRVLDSDELAHSGYL